MDEKFICTTDDETANKLKSIGFTCLGKDSGEWRFLNDSQFTFSKEDLKDVTYTNVINM